MDFGIFRRATPHQKTGFRKSRSYRCKALESVTAIKDSLSLGLDWRRWLLRSGSNNKTNNLIHLPDALPHHATRTTIRPTHSVRTPRFRPPPRFRCQPLVHEPQPLRSERSTRHDPPGTIHQARYSTSTFHNNPGRGRRERTCERANRRNVRPHRRDFQR